MYLVRLPQQWKRLFIQPDKNARKMNCLSASSTTLILGVACHDWIDVKTSHAIQKSPSKDHVLGDGMVCPLNWGKCNSGRLYDQKEDCRSKTGPWIYL